MAVFVNINGDERLATKLAEIGRAIKNPQKALREVGDFTLSEVSKQFKTEGNQLSTGWKRLDKNSRIQKAKMGFGSKSILERTGKLRKSFSAKVQRFKVTIASKGVKYYKYHQQGGKKLPQRVMLATPEKYKQEVVAILLNFIRTKLK